MPRCIAAFVLILISFVVRAAGAEVSLAWDPNPEPDLAGYRVYYGLSSGKYHNPVDTGLSTSVTIPDLIPGNVYYFAVTAYNTSGLESLPSTEAYFAAPLLDASVLQSVSGKFHGSLIDESTGEAAQIRLILTSTGQFTGRLIVGNQVWPLRGKFNLQGIASAYLQQIGQPNRILTLSLNPETGTLTAKIPADIGGKSLKSVRSSYSSANPAAGAGQYTMLLGQLEPAQETQAKIPGGSGFASVTVSRFGAVRGLGKLADGQPFAMSSQLDATAEFPVLSRTYQGFKGVVAGTLRLVETEGISDGHGTFWWKKPAQSGASLYRDSLNGTVSVSLSRWNHSLLGYSDSSIPPRAVLSSGDLPLGSGTLEKNLWFNVRGIPLVTNPSADRLAIRVDPVSGLISGSFVHPLDNLPHPIRGVFFRKQSRGAGYYHGVQTGGQFELLGACAR